MRGCRATFSRTRRRFSRRRSASPTAKCGRAEELTTYLTKVGYRPEKDDNSLGQFTVQGNTVDIRPSKLSYFAGSNAISVTFSGKKISQRSAPLGGGSDLVTADIEPELITNLFDSLREKRRPIRYDDIPPTLVHAIISAEDKRYLEHGGFDFVRIVGAAWADLRHSSRNYQGASTITMQVARTFFFSNERTWRRKLAEFMVAMELEQRFNKQQIFELYANEVYLGNRGSFGIRGFSEASVAYFGKDMRQLSLAECAYLAGIIRAPNYYSAADRHPERGNQARDRVLTQMLENKYISEADVQDAKRVPLKIVRTSITGGDAPYFVDMVKDHLLDKYSEQQLISENFRVYTTLDPALERAASSAIDEGAKNVDKLLAKKYDKWKKEAAKKGSNETVPQVAGCSCCTRSSHGRNQSSRRRPRLRPEPAESRAGASPAGFGLQAVRVRRGVRQRDRQRAADRHARDDDRRRAHDVRIRRQGIHAQQLRREVYGPRHRPRSAHQLAQRRHRKSRRADRLRPRRADRAPDGPRPKYSADSRRRPWRLRNDAGRRRRRLHRVRQRRHARRTRIHQSRHQRERRSRSRKPRRKRKTSSTRASTSSSRACSKT